LAEEIHSSASETTGDDTALANSAVGTSIPSTRGRTTAASRAAKSRPVKNRPVKNRAVKNRAARTAPAKTTRPKGAARPVRSLVILAMVGGLVATVALPAYGAWQTPTDSVTLQQVAADDAQSLVVASDSTNTELSRSSYSATTQEEIDKKKAEEAAAAAAAERARLATTASSASIPVNISLVSPGSGEVRWPILNFTLGRGLWDSGYHQGVDLLAPAMTPIYATAAGVVSISAESVGGYGVGIEIQHVIGGQNVASMYGHMTYGTRQVQAGETVAAGQLIGFVGSTGSSTANHLHFEVHINGSVVDPWAWLQANAG
jgi:murein DD-endopeptidase MepM/ murein hydrolase activator NlpD